MKTFEDEKIKLFEEIYRTCNQQLREWDVDEYLLQEGSNPLDDFIYARTGGLVRHIPKSQSSLNRTAAKQQTGRIDMLINEEVNKGTSIEKIINKIMNKYGGSYDKIKTYVESRIL